MALRRFQASLTVGTTGHAANDVIGGRIQLYGIGAPPGIRLHSIVISDKAAQSVDYVLTIFDAAPTSIADDASITTLNDADPAKIIYEASIDATTYRRTYTANSIHRVTGLDIPLASNESDGDLWAYLWTTGAPTYASASDVAIVLLYGPY